jgi:hypothetical protein
MEFRLLGPLEVWHEGRNLPVRGPCPAAFAARGPAGAADDRPLPVGSPGAGSRDVPGGASRACRRARHRAGAGTAGAGEGDPAEGPVTRASRGSTSASLHPGSRARRRRPPGAADDRADARAATAEEVIVAGLIGDRAGLALGVAAAKEDSSRLGAQGGVARQAVFTTASPGSDASRLASEQDADLVLMGSAARSARRRGEQPKAARLGPPSLPPAGCPGRDARGVRGGVTRGHRPGVPLPITFM